MNKHIIKVLSFFILNSKNRKSFGEKHSKKYKNFLLKIKRDKMYQTKYNMGFGSYANEEFYVANPKETKIGKYCSIANGVCLGLTQHPTDCLTTHGFIVNRKNPRFEGLLDVNDNAIDFPKEKLSPPITVGNDVWIGYRAVIMDGVKIGDGAVIAACSVVTKDVEPYTIVGGNPAKPIRKRFHDAMGGVLLQGFLN